MLKAKKGKQYQPIPKKLEVKKVGPVILILTLKSVNDVVTSNPVTNSNRAAPGTVIVQNSAVSEIKPQLQLNGNMRPTKFTVKADSTPASSVAAVISFFNNPTFSPASTDSHTVFTYSDGWGGKFMDLMLAQAGIAGITCYGFNVSCKDQNGVADSDAIDAMLASMLYYTGFGNKSVPASFDLNGLARKTDQKSGLETIKVIFNINALSQFTYSQGVNRVFNFTFFFEDFQL